MKLDALLCQPRQLDASVRRVGRGFDQSLLFQPGHKTRHRGLRRVEALLQRLEGQRVPLRVRQQDQHAVLLHGQVEGLQVTVGFLLQRVVDALDIPPSLLDTPVDYDSLMAIGSMMGSGGLIVMDEDNCMVDIAKFFLEFTVDESCGKCTPCREGTKRMLELLNKITDGKGEAGDIEKLEELANTIKTSSLCGLGQTAPNPVLSTLRYFRDEYEAHVYEKRCPAGCCSKLAKIVIDPDKCKGCSLCSKKCPVGAISGKIKEPFVIDQSKCIKCGVCIESCKFGAISKK